MLGEPIQTTLDQGVPLDQVTFCVVDLETTGGSPVTDRITEIGGVRTRGGERLGTFQSLVNPDRHIPPRIARLTGIDDSLVAGEPPIEHVLPSFVEFARGQVLVAHNARFDFAFLNQNLSALDYEPLPGPPVCTARLARRVVWPEVPNVKLRTLARYFRTRAAPIHRALADAEACSEVLQSLLTLAGKLGVRTLGDLHEIVRARGRPNFGKIRLADDLPRGPGVYVFRGRAGQALYVGKSKDLRARVKSYFYGDERKKIERLIDEVRTVEGIETHGELEALVVEARMIRANEPPYNRRGKGWRKHVYLKLDPSEAYPRLKLVRACKPDDGSRYLGPFTTTAQATQVKDALESIVPIRRCTTSMGAKTRFAACALADMGRCIAPCQGMTSSDRYEELIRGLISSLTVSPGGLLGALERQMDGLAAQQRYEQAAEARDRLHALASALHRDRQDRWLVNSGRLQVCGPHGTITTFEHGSLMTGGRGDEPLTLPCPRDRADELAAVRSWLTRHPGRILHADVALCEPVDGGAAIARVLSQRRMAAKAHRAQVARTDD